MWIELTKKVLGAVLVLLATIALYDKISLECGWRFSFIIIAAFSAMSNRFLNNNER